MKSTHWIALVLCGVVTGCAEPRRGGPHVMTRAVPEPCQILVQLDTATDDNEAQILVDYEPVRTKRCAASSNNARGSRGPARTDQWSGRIHDSLRFDSPASDPHSKPSRRGWNAAAIAPPDAAASSTANGTRTTSPAASPRYKSRSPAEDSSAVGPKGNAIERSSTRMSRKLERRRRQALPSCTNERLFDELLQ